MTRLLYVLFSVTLLAVFLTAFWLAQRPPPCPAAGWILHDQHLGLCLEKHGPWLPFRGFVPMPEQESEEKERL